MAGNSRWTEQVLVPEEVGTHKTIFHILHEDHPFRVTADGEQVVILLPM